MIFQNKIFKSKTKFYFFFLIYTCNFEKNISSFSNDYIACHNYTISHNRNMPLKMILINILADLSILRKCLKFSKGKLKFK